MEKAIEIIQNRINELSNSLNINFMGNEFYNDLQSKIDELESLLEDLKTYLSN